MFISINLFTSSFLLQVFCIFFNALAGVFWLGISVYAVFKAISSSPEGGAITAVVFTIVGLLFGLLVYSIMLIIPNVFILCPMGVIWLPRKTRHTIIILRICHIIAVFSISMILLGGIIYNIYELLLVISFCGRLICDLTIFTVDFFYIEVYYLLLIVATVIIFSYHIIVLVISIAETVRLIIERKKKLKNLSMI